MPTRLLGWLDRLRSSYWFLPTLMTVGAFLLSAATLAIDGSYAQSAVPRLGVLGGLNHPDGARALLSTVAGSLITVAGVVFSITLVGLSLASQQFGPRLVGNFMRDRGNQAALGTFLATFLYCLMVLRTVRSGDPQLAVAAFVPHVSVGVALLLTLASLGVFIYFIHHAAESVQVSYVLARVGRALTQQILAFPGVDDTGADPRGRDGGARPAAGAPEDADASGLEPATPDLPEAFQREAVTVRSQRAGYVQVIDLTGLVALAAEHDAVIRLHNPPGSFLMLGGPFADIYPAEAAEALAGRIEGYYLLGAVRTPQQDPYFLFDQLLEVALRALSPGVNDPFTAMTCIDRLAEAVDLLAHRRLPSTMLHGDDGALRLVVPRPELGALVEHLFGELRAHAAGDPMVARHLALTLRRMQASTSHRRLKRVVDDEVRRLLESAEGVLSASDLQGLRAASRRVTAWIRLEEE
ncbi:MAG TPA: DUF2254 domain-containing protein [Trueperaceae bacterium]|nr:DUF2254 domain-containing protein [Trueperaceae bacterium]